MQKFEIKFENTKLIGDVIGVDPSVLFLHGAGTADRLRFNAFRNLLHEAGISTTAFDFIGHGETGGDLRISSLEQRTRQALTVTQELPVKQPLTIIAASMSGYTAIKLTEMLKVERLIFLAAGMYTAKVYSLLFGEGFTETIREPNSWKDSDAWDILKNYKGELLIFAAEHDRVVPDELTKKIYDSAINASFKEIITIKGATHPLGKYLSEHPDDLNRVVERTIELIKPKLPL